MPNVRLMTTYHRVITPNVLLNGCRCHFAWYWSAVPPVALRLCQQVGSTGPLPRVLCAWLHWLGVTTGVRGQFGVNGGSSVLSNKTAGPSRLDPASLPATGEPPSPPDPTPSNRTMRACTRPPVIETAGLHSLFISVHSSAPITRPRWINPNNGSGGSVKRSPLSTRRAIRQNVQCLLFLGENSFNG